MSPLRVNEWGVWLLWHCRPLRSPHLMHRCATFNVPPPPFHTHTHTLLNVFPRDTSNMPPRRFPLLQIRADNGGVVGPRSTWGEGPSVPTAGAPATFLYLSAPGHYQEKNKEEEGEKRKKRRKRRRRKKRGRDPVCIVLSLSTAKGAGRLDQTAKAQAGNVFYFCSRSIWPHFLVEGNGNQLAKRGWPTLTNKHAAKTLP